MLLSDQTILGLRMTGKYTELIKLTCNILCIPYKALSFIGLVEFMFSIPEVKDKKLAFLSNNLCQDPLEQFFGCQRQRGGTSDNQNVIEFCHNTQALRVVDSFCRAPVRGNCRRKRDAPSTGENVLKENMIPLLKRQRKK